MSDYIKLQIEYKKKLEELLRRGEPFATSLLNRC